jgi:hypothetical protein
MISVLFCSRAKGNPDSDLPRLLDSAAAHTTPVERDRLEFLIKFDSDDDERPADTELARYPFKVRTFTWSRGEGRHGLHHAQEYLFAQRDPRSRFCLLTADDFVITRPGFVSDILAVPNEFCILGYSRPPIEQYAGVYEQEEAVRRWVTSFGSWSPVVSTRLIEVCQNLGWQANVDGWLMGLSVVLFDLYGVILWKQHEPFYERGGADNRPASVGAARTYNNMEITCGGGPANKYWFELLRRQARNIFLNIEYGSDLYNPLPVPRRLWRKLRAQPLRQLPLRLARKVVRVIGGSAPTRAAGPPAAADENRWMKTPDWLDDIPPEVHLGDVYVLRQLLRRVYRPGMVVVEVGSWVGNGSTRAIVETIRPAGGRAYCVDTWAGTDNVVHHRRLREQYPSMFPLFAENVRRYGGEEAVRPLILPSTDAARLFPNRSVDLVFIDGDHSYSAVKRDIAAWLPKVRPGGILCGHDCDADFGALDPRLRRACEPYREDDVYLNEHLPGPPAIHVGVAAAVHERFGPAATLWREHHPSTIWSHDVRAGLLARLARRFGRPTELPAAPWPEVEAGHEAVAG